MESRPAGPGTIVPSDGGRLELAAAAGGPVGHEPVAVAANDRGAPLDRLPVAGPEAFEEERGIALAEFEAAVGADRIWVLETPADRLFTDLKNSAPFASMPCGVAWTRPSTS